MLVRVLIVALKMVLESQWYTIMLYWLQICKQMGKFPQSSVKSLLIDSSQSLLVDSYRGDREVIDVPIKEVLGEIGSGLGTK